MKTELRLIARVMLGVLLTNTLIATAWSEEQEHSGHTSHETMGDMSMSGMSMDDMSMENKSMNHDGMNMSMPMKGNGMAMGNKAAQGGSAPADARDPHANSGGYKRDPLRRLVLADEIKFASLRVDRLEMTNSDNTTSGVFDVQAWYGVDYDRLVIKAEGDVSDKALEEASTELLWGHAIAPFWNTQLGLRYDGGEGPNRSWLALGVQGLAPYWFELDTTFYVGEGGRTALAIEAEYEMLITQRLVLQPRMESTVYGKSDTEKRVGSGFSDLSLGLRLRYEFKREFAPYIGFERVNKFGGTADFARASGGSKVENIFVAGLRFWL